MKALTRILPCVLLPWLLVAGGCMTNASTGRKQLLLMSTQQSIALGEESKGPLTEEYGGGVSTTDFLALLAHWGKCPG